MERRRAERRPPTASEPLCRVRLRTGKELSVLDVSDEGALVEGARLLPGTHVDVHVTTNEGRVLVRSRVVRSYVAALQANAVCYRGALAFEKAVDTAIRDGYRLPWPHAAEQGATGTDYPVAASSMTASVEHPLTV